MPIREDFAAETEPYRRELQAHCYRMLGSLHDAEDLLQETLLRAWRSYDTFDATRASLRTWLHRIATNACLTALDSRARRPLPSGLGAPSDDPGQNLVPGHEIPWLEPFPGVGFDDEDPASVVTARSSLRLALVAALQLLPPRQRAVLILRDVLAWSAAEVAELLETTPTAVNSALQRARHRLEQEGVVEEHLAEPSAADQRALLDRYMKAFENADLGELEHLLTADAVLEMPPFLTWYAGRDAYIAFIARVFRIRGTDWRLLTTSANGQPAFGAYVREADGGYVAHTLQVLEVTRRQDDVDGAAAICRNSVFSGPGVFETFGLPTRLDGSAG